MENKTLYTTSSLSAYFAAGCFVLGIATAMAHGPIISPESPPSLLVTISVCAFILFHLAMLPVISALPASDWAKASGFVWVAVDNVLEMATFFGIGDDLVLPLRWGIHLATATWLIGASISQQGLLRWWGLMTAALLVLTSMVGPFLDRSLVPQTLGLSATLFIVWIVLAGNWLAKSTQTKTRAEY